MAEFARTRRSPRRASTSPSKRPAGGIPVDSAGGPTVDPTENVKALNAASDERQNDLRDAGLDYVLLLDRRQDDLRIKGEQRARERSEYIERYARERSELVRFYEKEIREKETQRIDAINKSNTEAVQAAAEVARAQATLLANQVATTGETLRAQVASVASAQEQRLTTILGPITDAVESLRKAQYEQQGQRAASSDPVLQAIRELQLSQQTTLDARVNAGATRQQSNWAVSAALVVIGLLISIGLFALAIIEATRPAAVR
jgi:hypothetical protein